MTTHNLTCIGCPMGCQLTVTLENGVVTGVTGNTCRIGDNYARKEVTSPTRIVTSTVAVIPAGETPQEGRHYERISVKTASDVPKSKIMDVMADIQKTYAVAPVKIGDVVLENVAGTGVSVIATRARQ